MRQAPTQDTAVSQMEEFTPNDYSNQFLQNIMLSLLFRLNEKTIGSEKDEKVIG